MNHFSPKISSFRVLVALFLASLTLSSGAETFIAQAAPQKPATPPKNLIAADEDTEISPFSLDDLPRIPSPLTPNSAPDSATPNAGNFPPTNTNAPNPTAPNAANPSSVNSSVNTPNVPNVKSSNSSVNSSASAKYSSSTREIPSVLPAATEAKLRALLASSDFADAHIGVCIKALGTANSAADFPAKSYANNAQPILFSSDADKRFLPVSNMKLFTAALALKSLGAEKRFSTRVMTSSGAPANSATNASANAISSTRNDGVVLYIVGGGDPSLGLDDLAQMARDVRKSGVTRVSGIVADTSLFQAETLGGRYPDGWTLDDAIWYYGAEVSALALERNQVDITITGTRKGRAAKAEVSPQLPGFALGTDILTQVQTGENELKNLSESALIQFERGDFNNALGAKLTVKGQIAPGQIISDGVAIPNVARQVALAFSQQLQAAGVQVVGSADVGILPDAPNKTIAQHDSAPLRVLVQRFLKKSDNLYGEMLLRDVGAFTKATFDAKSGNTSSESSGAGIASSGVAARAHNVLLDWLKMNKIATGALRFSDGSGLSRYNLLTPRAVVSLLGATEKLSGSRAFYDALPIAGADGTLKNRMANTRAANNVRAKTGTFSIASCLSGYVTTRDGQRLAVSILTNFARNGDDARRLQNDIFVALADTSWTP